MPIRQMKEGSEQHLVIKSQVNNPVNPVHKAPKAYHNGKGPPSQERQVSEAQNMNSSSAKNRGRRRSRGTKKNGLCDELSFLRPPKTNGYRITNGCLENESGFCDSEMSVPSSSKSLRFPARPGFGKSGTRVIIKANHFFTELPNNDLIHYDVKITPEVASKNVNRSVIAELVKLHRESELGMRLPAYDGRRSLYTAGDLPFSYKEFTIKLLDENDGTNGPRGKVTYIRNPS